MVARRGEEAGDHQLPHLQAGARRAVLRQDLRPDEGLRVQLRQVQAHEAPRRRLREVRRRGHPVEGAPRAHGPHRPGHAGRAHLVPELAAVAHRHPARHHAQGAREGPLLRVLRRHRPGRDAARAQGAAHRERKYREAREEYGDGFKAGMGAEAIRTLLKRLDLDELAEDLRVEMQATRARRSARRSPSASRSSTRSASRATSPSG